MSSADLDDKIYFVVSHLVVSDIGLIRLVAIASSAIAVTAKRLPVSYIERFYYAPMIHAVVFFNLIHIYSEGLIAAVAAIQTASKVRP